MTGKQYCKMCFNATVDPALKGKNDLHYLPLGVTEDCYAIYFRSGEEQPTEILFEDKKTKEVSHLVGRYQPDFCPNCGRKLKENIKYNKKIFTKKKKCAIITKSR